MIREAHVRRVRAVVALKDKESMTALLAATVSDSRWSPTLRLALLLTLPLAALVAISIFNGPLLVTLLGAMGVGGAAVAGIRKGTNRVQSEQSEEDE